MVRWLRADDRPADREIKQLSKKMFAANPELNALRNARMAAVIDEGTRALADQLSSSPTSPRAPSGTSIPSAVRFLDAGIAGLREPAS